MSMPAESLPVAPNPDGPQLKIVKAQDPFSGKKPKDIADYVSDANKKFTQCQETRQQFEKVWYTNLAFFFGKQNAQWTSSTSFDNSRLYEPPALPWRVRMVVNKVRSVVRREHAKLIKEDAQCYVLPASTDDEDVIAARAGETIVQYVFDEAKYNTAKTRAALWMCLTGTAFTKTYYSQEKDEIYIDPVTSFALYVPNLQEEEIERQPFVIHASTKTVKWIKDTYHIDVKADTTLGNAPLENRLLQGLGINKPSKEDGCYVKEMWIQPCGDHPEGAVLTWTGETALGYADFLPYGPTYPFAKIEHIPAGRFYGTSVIEDLVPLQKERNKTISQLLEAKNRMARPQWVAQKGSLDARKMTTEPGLMIFYNPGFQAPVQAQMASIPSYVIEELNRIDQDIDFISGQNAITRGSNMQGIRSAAALSYLQEQADAMLLPATNSIEMGTEKTGKIILNIVSQYWDEEHLVKVVGHNNAFEANMFSKADIRGNTDFHVVQGSAQPQSLAAKQAVLTEFGKLGWIKPDQVLKYLRYSETDRLYEDSQLDEHQATREFTKISETAQYIPTNDYDNHMAHFTSHTSHMRTESYEQEDPQIKQLKAQHLAETRQRIMALGINPDTGQPIAQPQGSPQLAQHANKGAEPQEFGAPPTEGDHGF